MTSPSVIAAKDQMLAACRDLLDRYGVDIYDPHDALTVLAVVGSLVKSLAARGFIVKSGEYRPRTQGHGSPADVWKSLIYQGRRTA